MRVELLGYLADPNSVQNAQDKQKTSLLKQRLKGVGLLIVGFIALFTPEAVAASFFALPFGLLYTLASEEI
jgi:polyferredoxin